MVYPPMAEPMPDAIPLEEWLAVVRRLAWDTAAILWACARGHVPPFGDPALLTVENDPNGPVNAADLSVNDGSSRACAPLFPPPPGRC